MQLVIRLKLNVVNVMYDLEFETDATANVFVDAYHNYVFGGPKS